MGEPDSDALAIRAATTDDAALVVALVESAYRGDASRKGWTTEADLLGGQRTDLAAVHSAIERSDGALLVGELDGLLVACCELSMAGKDAWFGMFAVRPELQGNAHGDALLATAERWAAEHWHAEALRMKVIRQRSALIAWYGRRGYLPTGATAPFPYGDERFGIPKRNDLEFVVLAKPLG